MRMLFALFISLVSATAWAQSAAISAPFDFETSDGVAATLVADHRVPLVHIALQFPVGGHSAWFIENHGEAAFGLQDMDSSGDLRATANANAISVSFDVTDLTAVISVTGLKEDTHLMKQLLVDILANTDIDEAEIKRTRQGIKVGWASQQKDPDFTIHTATAELMYASDDPRLLAYRQPVALAKQAEPLVLTRDEIVRLPGRRIGFSGDLTLTEAKDLAEGLLPAATSDVDVAVNYRPLNEGRPSEINTTLANLNQVYLAFTSRAPAILDDDFAAFMIAQQVLGGHFHSRLYKALRHDEGDTYGARAETTVSLVPGLISLTTFSRLDNAGKIEGKLRGVLSTFHADGITATELENATTNWAGGKAFDRQSPHTVLMSLLSNRAMGLPDEFDDTLLADVRALSVADVNAVITRIFDPAAFTMVRLVVEE